MEGRGLPRAPDRGILPPPAPRWIDFHRDIRHCRGKHQM